MDNFYIDVEALRKRTQSAIKAGQITAEMVARRKKEEEERKQAMEELKVQEILSQVGPRCEQEASAGRNFAVIYSLDSLKGDYDHSGPPYNVCEPAWLQGVARKVYKSLDAAGLKPTLDYWCDGAGMDSGFNLVIHW